MAYLYYKNLTSHRPDVLMKMTFSGLRNFFKFLDTTKRYQESEKAVKRLSWELAHKDNDVKEREVWIQLIEPKNATQNIETSFKLFLDENNDKVYETGSFCIATGAEKKCSECTYGNGTPRIAYQSEFHANKIADKSNTQLSVYKCPKGQGWHLTHDLKENLSFHKDSCIAILSRDPEKEQLLLERKPTHEFLVLRPNTYQLLCQIRAIQSLQNEPGSAHRPLLRLFESTDHAEWDDFGEWENVNDDWFFLTDTSCLGTDKQREFVEVALNTPDFAFLEGPPGSGKTTAICELILQLAVKRKRILLCASTHVAVDNVLERLMDERNESKDLVIPIRIGEAPNVSEKAKPWQLENFINTERKRLLASLRSVAELSESQQELYDQLRSGKDHIQKLILECANLICGTTIGILQHPDIKNKSEQSPQFDVLIIDEVSKTTFQEFLVPALLAKKWILVGDRKQLSPYVDDESMAVNIVPCLPEEFKRQACIDVFKASRKNTKQRAVSLVCTSDSKVIDFYEKQAEHCGIPLASKQQSDHILPYAAVTVGSKEYIESNIDKLALDITHVRTNDSLLDSINRRVSAYSKLSFANKQDDLQWEEEISWRLSRLYEQRLNTNRNFDSNSVRLTTSKKLEKEIDDLLPFDNRENDYVNKQIDLVSRVALPSILESLQKGFERNPEQNKGTALSDGLPEKALNDRLVTLTYQYRMHPEIALFSHEHIYQKKSLFSPEGMEEKRKWNYKNERNRCIWIDVKGKKNKQNANEDEADQLMDELKEFDIWSRCNLNIDKKNGLYTPWEVAVLTFYRGQGRELRNRLRQWTGNRSGVRHFRRGSRNNVYLDIQLCTVDRFQGHEADLVLLSFTSHYPTSFLESPNRLNVAITRARYQLVVFGNRKAMEKASGVLSNFANQTKWERNI